TLPQRLAAMAAEPRLRRRGPAAAQALLGATLLAEIERGLDEYWRERHRAPWRERYEAAAPERARLAALEGVGTPTAQERLEHARLVEALRVDFDAEPLYARLIDAQPDSAMAHYRAGVLALRRGDANLGVARLRRAVALDAGAVRPVLA